jgi:hypothetical protein
VSRCERPQVFLSGGPLYFIFHIRTRDYYYSQTVLAGGATYRATGRGFVTHHSPFDENYRFFANSHFYMGFEMLVLLILLAVYSTAGEGPLGRPGCMRGDRATRSTLPGIAFVNWFIAGLGT